MEKEIKTLCREIAALRGAIDRLTKKLGAHCVPARAGAETGVEWEEEPEADNPDYPAFEEE